MRFVVVSVILSSLGEGGKVSMKGLRGRGCIKGKYSTNRTLSLIKFGMCWSRGIV